MHGAVFICARDDEIDTHATTPADCRHCTAQHCPAAHLLPLQNSISSLSLTQFRSLFVPQAETQLVKEEPFVPLAQPQSLRDAQPKLDDAVENGLGNVADIAENASVRTPSSDIDDKDELEALLEILTEAFNEVDLENSGVISTEQLGIVLEGLVEEGVIDMYTDGRSPLECVLAFTLSSADMVDSGVSLLETQT
jgi:hypothetical protein